MEIENELLLEKAAAGDQKSFRLLYDRLAPRILAFLLQMLSDRHLAEDVLQETMIQTWRKADQFDAGKARASTWIIAIARNRAIDLLRKTGRFERVVQDSGVQIEQVMYSENPGANPDGESTLTRERLDRCLGELSENTVACIRLAYINGFSIREIAAYRNDSINTVKSWVRRGLEKLGECMQR